MLCDNVKYNSLNTHVGIAWKFKNLAKNPRTRYTDNAYRLPLGLIGQVDSPSHLSVDDLYASWTYALGNARRVADV